MTTDSPRASAPSDPAGLEHRKSQLTEATTRLLEAIDAVPPEAVRDPSKLPGWRVGHVLTHIARNADAQRNLLSWAATGIRTPMYPSSEARNDDIQDGAGRAPDDIVADVRVSASLLSEAISGLPDSAWAAQIDTGRGGPVSADVVLAQRLAEVELHHHDLGIDAGLELLTDEAGRHLLAAVLHSFIRTRGIIGLLLRPDGAEPVRLDSPDPDAPGIQPGPEATTVQGPAAGLAGWLSGRTDGSDLSCDGPLPTLPPW